MKNHFASGDSIELIQPGGNRHLTLGELRDAKSGDTVPAAKGSGWRVQADLGAVGEYTVLAKNL